MAWGSYPTPDHAEVPGSPAVGRAARPRAAARVMQRQHRSTNDRRRLGLVGGCGRWWPDRGRRGRSLLRNRRDRIRRNRSRRNRSRRRRHSGRPAVGFCAPDASRVSGDHQGRVRRRCRCVGHPRGRPRGAVHIERRVRQRSGATLPARQRGSVGADRARPVASLRRGHARAPASRRVTRDPSNVCFAGPSPRPSSGPGRRCSATS